MGSFDAQYIDLCKRILDSGEKVRNYAPSEQRDAEVTTTMPGHATQAESGASTLRLPHEVMQFDLEKEFPILASKKVGWKSAILEILWIYQAASNDVRWLQERGVHIWDEWQADENGVYQGRDLNQIYALRHPGERSEDFAYTIGTAYGWIVGKYGLMQSLLATLKTDPGNRRMVMSLWQNEWLETAALPSCVWNSQWNVTGGRLNLLVTSRSTDVPLGLPYNIVQYAALCYMVAQVTGVRPGRFTFITNDAHIYENQVDGIREQIRRYDEAVRDDGLPEPPRLWLNPAVQDFYHFDNSKELRDIRLDNYNNLGTIKMPVTE